MDAIILILQVKKPRQGKLIWLAQFKWLVSIRTKIEAFMVYFSSGYICDTTLSCTSVVVMCFSAFIPGFCASMGYEFKVGTYIKCNRESRIYIKSESEYLFRSMCGKSHVEREILAMREPERKRETLTGESVGEDQKDYSCLQWSFLWGKGGTLIEHTNRVEFKGGELVPLEKFYDIISM